MAAKSTGTHMEQNYVTVTPCIRYAYRTYEHSEIRIRTTITWMEEDICRKQWGEMKESKCAADGPDADLR